MSLEQMKSRLEQEIARRQDDIKFWTEDTQEARFLESHDGSPLKDFTEERIERMRKNLERDKQLLEQIERALKEG